MSLHHRPRPANFEGASPGIEAVHHALIIRHLSRRYRISSPLAEVVARLAGFRPANGESRADV